MLPFLLLLAHLGAAQATEPTQRAVLAVVHSYSYDHPRFGWRTLHTDRDLVLMREALKARGFTAIRELEEEEATAAGILGALDATAAEAQPGDHVLFYWSGHGQQIADDEADDEIDRLDEALVAWGAPRTDSGGYDGSAHLRDDELGERLLALRRAVGPTGSVVVAIDSCHSGTATRAEGIVRGGAEPIGTPAPAAAPGRSDFVESAEKDDALAPYAVLTAARAHQLAREVPVGAESHGAFTAALAESLAAGSAASWSGVLDQVRARVIAQVRDQVPQLEGTRELAVFGSEAGAAEPSFAVESVDGQALVLGGGSLHGVRAGSEVEVHAAGSARPSPETRLAAGTVEGTELVTAAVTLAEAPADPDAVRAGRVFVTRAATGELGLGLAVDPALAEWRESLAGLAQVQLVDEEAEASLRVEPGPEGERVVLVHRAAEVAKAPLPASEADRAALIRAVQSLAYTALLEGVRLEDPNYAVRVELRPAKRVDKQCVPTGEVFVSEGGEVELPIGSRVQIVLHPAGGRYFYPTVVHTGQDGVSAQLYPRHAPERVSPLDGAWALPSCPRVTGPPGTEQLTLFATSAPIDLSPLIGKVPTEATREELAPIQVLLDAVGREGQGLAPTRGEQQGYTATVAYRIVEADSR